MNYNWYKIFNLAAFTALGLVSQTYTLELEDLGQKDILVTKGNHVSMLYEGVYLTLEFNDQNPFAFDGHAIYLDEAGDVWLGIEDES